MAISLFNKQPSSSLNPPQSLSCYNAKPPEFTENDMKIASLERQEMLPGYGIHTVGKMPIPRFFLTPCGSQKFLANNSNSRYA